MGAEAGIQLEEPWLRPDGRASGCKRELERREGVLRLGEAEDGQGSAVADGGGVGVRACRGGERKGQYFFGDEEEGLARYGERGGRLVPRKKTLGGL